MVPRIFRRMTSLQRVALVVLLIACGIFLMLKAGRKTNNVEVPAEVECVQFTEIPPRLVAPPRVLFITHELRGITLNGGIGTLNFDVASLLTSAGFPVTVLLTDESVRHAEQVTDVCGISIFFLPETIQVDGLGWFGSRSLQISNWLKQHEDEFDIVHLHDYLGLGAIPLAVKSIGEHFTKLKFVTYTHSPSTWTQIMNREPINTGSFLTTDFMERQTVELADVVISPSRYMLNWLNSSGYALPADAAVMRLYVASWEERASEERFFEGLSSIFFVGRLEQRKGLVMFCDAIDSIKALSPSLLAGKTVSFYGKPGNMIDGVQPTEYIERRAKAGRWGHALGHIGGLAHDKMIRSLKAPGALAVMPYLEDNSPFSVMEMLVNNVAFIASQTGGIPELISAASGRDGMLFVPRAAALSRLLTTILSTDTVAHVRPSWSPSDTQRDWLDFHTRLAAPGPADAGARAAGPPQFLISVVIVTRNRRDMCLQALESIQAQTYPNVEIILVDDCSDGPQTPQWLAATEQKFSRMQKWIRNNESLYVGASRNAGALAAKGKYILFMDDDNYAKPNELEVFARIAAKTDLDIITCYFDSFTGPDAPPYPASSLAKPSYGFIGPSVSLGLFHNCFGDSNMFVKASAFARLGGFSLKYDVAYDDWKLLANAAILGYKLGVVPESLFWKRYGGETMLQQTSRAASQEEVISLYGQHFPSMWSMMHMAQHNYLRLAYSQ